MESGPNQGQPSSPSECLREAVDNSQFSSPGRKHYVPLFGCVKSQVSSLFMRILDDNLCHMRLHYLLMIFFRYSRVKFAFFFYVIRDSCVQEKGGTKRIKLNISQNFFGLLRVILTSEGT